MELSNLLRQMRGDYYAMRDFSKATLSEVVDPQSVMGLQFQARVKRIDESFLELERRGVLPEHVDSCQECFGSGQVQDPDKTAFPLTCYACGGSGNT